MRIVSRAGSGCSPDNRWQHRSTTSRDNYGNEQYRNADRNDYNIAWYDRNSDRHTDHHISDHDDNAGNHHYYYYPGNDHTSFRPRFTRNQSRNA